MGWQGESEINDGPKLCRAGGGKYQKPEEKTRQELDMSEIHKKFFKNKSLRTKCLFPWGSLNWQSPEVEPVFYTEQADIHAAGVTASE